jgi:hypothetical protein
LEAGLEQQIAELHDYVYKGVMQTVQTFFIMVNASKNPETVQVGTCMHCTGRWTCKQAQDKPTRGNFLTTDASTNVPPLSNAALLLETYASRIWCTRNQDSDCGFPVALDAPGFSRVCKSG